MKTNRFHLAMFAAIAVTNVLWLEPFPHSSETWVYLDRTNIEVKDFAENARLRGSPMEERYEFHWPPGQGSGFILAINEEELKNGRYLVAGTNLLLCFVWLVGTVILKAMRPRGQNNGRQPEPVAAPNSRQPSQLPPSPEIPTPDSQRTSSSGGCG